MTYCSTYIGDLADPAFHWDGGDWNGNIPRGISPAFPPAPTPNNYNKKFHDWVALTKVLANKRTTVDGLHGYGLTRVVRSGEKQDVARKKHCDQILKKIKRTNPKPGDLYDEFINLVMTSLEKELINREMSQRLIKMVESGSLSLEVAIARLNGLLKCPQADTK